MEGDQGDPDDSLDQLKAKIDEVPFIPTNIEFDFNLVHKIETSKEYLNAVNLKI